MPRTSRSLLLLAVAAATAVAGCGGGDYPSKPDDICKKAAEELNGVARPKAVGDLHVYLLRFQEILTKEIRQLKEVKPPSDKQSAYSGFVGGLDQTLTVVRRATNISGQQPRRALTLLARQGASAAAVRPQQAMAAGLKECAKSQARQR